MQAKTASVIFICCIVGARVAMGLFFSITEPTLPTLAANVKEPIETVSWIFTVRAGIEFAKNF